MMIRSPFYQQVDVPVVSDEHCRDAYGQSEITDSMICAGKTIFRYITILSHWIALVVPLRN